MATTTVFTNNRSQAVRLPADARFPADVKKVLVRTRGVERILTPEGQTWDSFFLGGPAATEDFLTDRATDHPSEREAL